METDSTRLLKDIEDSKQELKDNLRHLGSHVRQTVDDTKDKVDSVIHDVSEKVSLKRQTEKHPLLMFGASILAGAVTYRFVGRPVRRDAANDFFQRLFCEYRPEMNLAKGMAIQIAVQKLVEKVDESFPQWKAQTRELVQTLKSRRLETTPEVKA